MTALGFILDDGGRAAAGYRGHTGDCVARSIAIVGALPYQQVYDDLNLLAKLERPRGKRKRSGARTGVHRPTISRYLVDHLAWSWTPTMQIGSGCRVHLRADELPDGRLVVNLSKHLTAVIDHVIHDTYDPSRDGTRCVYGYWTPPALGACHHAVPDPTCSSCRAFDLLSDEPLEAHDHD